MSSRELWVNKALTTSERVFTGISEALAVTASQLGLEFAQLCSNKATIFSYGTTFSTNAIITRDTAKTAFLTTLGHPDTLVLREGGKHNPFDFRGQYPEPYVPRRLTFEVPERVNSEGDVLLALDEQRVVEIAAELKARNVEAVAVCFLWSILNPVHEKRTGEILQAQLPGIPVTLSHELNPILREYRRASSAVIDASMKPLMQKHLKEMEQDLRNGGFAGALLVGTSFGGVLTVEDVASRPIYTVNSAPAMAPVAGRANAPGEDSLIVCDMGGTSFDVSLVRGGYLKFTRETWIGPQFTGHMTGLSAVDIKNIGAGGGSIAWIDSGGLMRVGPQSAKALPGPACYGRGGTLPTVTDASLVLGHVDPDYFLGGRIRLDLDAAFRAIETHIAKPLGLTIQTAAHAILTIANENMVNAIRSITINEGLDPRASLLIAGGGAGGMTIGRIAEALECARVLVPRTAGALSASGGLFSDIVSEFSVSQRTDTGGFDYAGINQALAGLNAQMDAFFERLKTPQEQRRREFFVEARYPYQVWELEVPLAVSQFSNAGDVQSVRRGISSARMNACFCRQRARPAGRVHLLEGPRHRGMLPKPLRGVTRPVWPQHAQPLVTRDAWFDGLPRRSQHRVTMGRICRSARVLEWPLHHSGADNHDCICFRIGSATVTETGDYMMERKFDAAQN